MDELAVQRDVVAGAGGSEAIDCGVGVGMVEGNGVGAVLALG